MQNVETEILLPPVSVCQAYKETLMWSASLNALSTKSVLLTWLVSGTNVQILVQECAGHMLSAQSTIIIQIASVSLVTLEIHSHIVFCRQPNRLDQLK
jgi:hypothetical protein